MSTYKRLVHIGEKHKGVPGVLTWTIVVLNQSRSLGLEYFHDLDVLREKDQANRGYAATNARMYPRFATPMDRYLPWVADHLSRSIREARSEPADWRFSMTLGNLHTFLPLIADWARATHTDLGRLSVNEAIDGQLIWHDEQAHASRRVPAVPAPVAFELEGDWTVQALSHGKSRRKIRERLVSEGESMGHCVGGGRYLEDAIEGRIHVFSLRDPQNLPHVTIEISRSRLFPVIRQFFGPLNGPVPAEMCEKIRPWLESLNYNLVQLGPAGRCFPETEL